MNKYAFGVVAAGMFTVRANSPEEALQVVSEYDAEMVKALVEAERFGDGTDWRPLTVEFRGGVTD